MSTANTSRVSSTWASTRFTSTMSVATRANESVPMENPSSPPWSRRTGGVESMLPAEASDRRLPDPQQGREFRSILPHHKKRKRYPMFSEQELAFLQAQRI